MDNQEPTVKSVLKDLYEFNQASIITTEGKLITIKDYQELIYQYIDLLTNLLGIELEG